MGIAPESLGTTVVNGWNDFTSWWGETVSWALLGIVNGVNGENFPPKDL